MKTMKLWRIALAIIGLVTICQLNWARMSF